MAAILAGRAGGVAGEARFGGDAFETGAADPGVSAIGVLGVVGVAETAALGVFLFVVRKTIAMIADTG